MQGIHGAIQGTAGTQLSRSLNSVIRVARSHPESSTGMVVGTIMEMRIMRVDGGIITT
jgi:hypothetical protein